MNMLEFLVEPYEKQKEIFEDNDALQELGRDLALIAAREYVEDYMYILDLGGQIGGARGDYVKINDWGKFARDLRWCQDTEPLLTDSDAAHVFELLQAAQDGDTDARQEISDIITTELEHYYTDAYDDIDVQLGAIDRAYWDEPLYINTDTGEILVRHAYTIIMNYRTAAERLKAHGLNSDEIQNILGHEDIWNGAG